MYKRCRRVEANLEVGVCLFVCLLDFHGKFQNLTTPFQLNLRFLFIYLFIPEMLTFALSLRFVFLIVLDEINSEKYMHLNIFQIYFAQLM